MRKHQVPRMAHRVLKEVLLTFRHTTPTSFAPGTESKRWFFEVPAQRDDQENWSELLHRITYNANCFLRQEQPSDNGWWAIESFQTQSVDSEKALAWDGKTTEQSALSSIPWCVLRSSWEPSICYWVDQNAVYDALDFNAYCELLAFRWAEQGKPQEKAVEFLKKLYPDVWERIWGERLQRMENIACIREPNPIPVFRERGERPWISGPPQSP